MSPLGHSGAVEFVCSQAYSTAYSMNIEKMTVSSYSSVLSDATEARQIVTSHDRSMHGPFDFDNFRKRAAQYKPTQTRACTEGLNNMVP